MYVLKTVFERHIEFLRDTFEIVSFSQLLSLWREKRWDHHKRYCVITFDDGWLDNYECAFPILKKHGVPATIFLPTDYIGSRRWFWPEKLGYILQHLWDPSTERERQRLVWNCLTRPFGKALYGYEHPCLVPPSSRQELADLVIEQCKLLPPDEIEAIIEEISALLRLSIPDARLVMGWKEIAEMSESRITFGSHSCSHRLLTNIPLSEVRVELERSWRRLKEMAVNVTPVFCYPNGNTNHDVQSLVRDCGYEAAVGVEKGMEGPEPANLYHLRRISIHNDITVSIPLFAFHLLGPLN
jgi:peptidoglycan/xylan/chitin deacetylase (PgdA/CDA1 family)